MPQAIPMLLADWTEMIGFLIFVGFGILRFLLSDSDEAKNKKPAKQAPRQQPQPQPQPNRPAGAQGELRSEVEAFLRRAQGLPEPEEEPKQELVPDDTPQRLSDRRPTLTPIEMEQAEDAPDLSVSEHVSQHLRHLKESQLAENAAKLGEQVALADDKVQARLEAKFTHRLGKLDSRQDEPHEAPPADKQAFGADQIAAMLANPDGMRNAVILNEILTRPADRW